LGKYEVARIGGIPLILDMSLLLLVVFWMLPVLQRGDTLSISMTGLVVAGVLFSILLHELGHAFAGQMFGVGTSHIELNGLGGLCYYNGMPRFRWQRLIMALAGPAVTFLIWRFCVSSGNLIVGALENGVDSEGLVYVEGVLWRIGQINLFMLIFNLLPSFPLDGGTALKELLAMRLDPYKANWIVSWLGIIVAAGCAYMSMAYGTWMLIMAAMLFFENYRVLTTETRTPWQRWN
jgi:Zn-dependent protease